MTTSHSPLSAIKSQADQIAKMLKAFERGEKIEGRFAEKLVAARDKPSVKFGIVMDDKVLTIDMPWDVIRKASEGEISDFIVKHMRGQRKGH